MTLESINATAVWLEAHPLALIALVFWVLIWKGLALWKAAGLRQKYWFAAILTLNTLGLLEIFYLLIVARKYEVEVVDKR